MSANTATLLAEILVIAWIAALAIGTTLIIFAAWRETRDNPDELDSHEYWCPR